LSVDEEGVERECGYKEVVIPGPVLNEGYEAAIDARKDWDMKLSDYKLIGYNNI
jgi:hypothetical protein